MFIFEIIYSSANQSQVNIHMHTNTYILYEHLKTEVSCSTLGRQALNMPLECMVTHVSFPPLIHTLFNIETNLVTLRLKLKSTIISQEDQTLH